jgi:pimeloyl-ACP methyl ester carboxylesterase
MINYKIVGKGRTVLFLHGFLESHSMWNVFDLENAPFSSLLIDLPGHGSSLLTESNSITEIAKEIYDLLNSLNLDEEIDLIGHSLGGYVAIELHKLLAKKGKLILFHSNFWEDDLLKKNDRNRVIEVVQSNKNLFINEAIPNLFLEDFRGSEFVKQLINEAKLISKDSIILYSQLMRDRHDNTDYIMSNLANTLFIQGKFDPIVKQENLDKFKFQLNAVYTNAGHMGHIEDTENEFLQITNFINQIK